MLFLLRKASSEHSICVGVEDAGADKAKEAVDKAFEIEIAQEKLSH